MILPIIAAAILAACAVRIMVIINRNPRKCRWCGLYAVEGNKCGHCGGAS